MGFPHTSGLARPDPQRKAPSPALNSHQLNSDAYHLVPTQLNVRSSADEKVDVATDPVHASLVDGTELALDAVVGQGPDLLGHCVRGASQPGGFVGRHRHVVAQTTVGAGEGHGQEQAGDDRVALVGYDDDGAPAALLTPSGGIQIREQDVARVQATPLLYSGYSSAAVSA